MLQTVCFSSNFIRMPILYFLNLCLLDIFLKRIPCYIIECVLTCYFFFSSSLTGLWWIILLRAYCKITGDYALQERVDVQTGLKMILNLCLTDGFDMFPSLLVTDGSCMIDRRMGIHGHPLEIQVSSLCLKHFLLFDSFC